MREEIELLEHHSHPLPDRPHLRFVVARIQAHPEHIQPARIQRLQTVEGSDEGAFARSGGAHHHQNLSADHLEAHPIKSPLAWGVTLHQIDGSDGDGHQEERRGSSWISRWRASSAMAVQASQ